MLFGEMRVALQLLTGALSCAVFIFWARRLRLERELRLYALALVVAALIYLGFAASGAANFAWLALELTGLLVFTLFALAGLKISAWILAAGWAAHAAWDLILHKLADADFVPAWYPLVCLSFDLLLAGYIAARFGRHQR
jgi:hypothetical protein